MVELFAHAGMDYVIIDLQHASPDWQTLAHMLRAADAGGAAAIVRVHTHEPSLDRYAGVTVINGGSVGAGGTGNLTESTNYGLARLIYTTEPTFQPLAADLIEIDPGDGSSTASRQRLENEPEN